MRIAVLGANGRIAHEVARAFLAHGHSVVAVTRNGQCPGLSGDVEYRAADAMQADQLIAATRGADLVFNGLNPPYDQWASKAMTMARNVIAAAKANGLPHLFIGNVYNYGSSISLDSDENTPFAADTRKGRIRVEMEALFAREAMESGVQTVILRAGDFYGTNGRGSWFDLFIASKVDKGVFTWPGPMDAVHAFAYLPDLAEAFVRLGERMDRLATFETFTFAGHSLTGYQFQAWVEAAAGRHMKSASVPWWLFRLAGPFHPMLNEVNEMAYLWKVPHSLSGRKLSQAIGEPASTPPEAAIAQALVEQGKIAPRQSMAA